MNIRRQTLLWHSVEQDPPEKVAGRPILVKFREGEYEVLTWYDLRQAFCVGNGGWGEDRYQPDELCGEWAVLS